MQHFRPTELAHGALLVSFFSLALARAPVDLRHPRSRDSYATLTPDGAVVTTKNTSAGSLLAVDSSVRTNRSGLLRAPIDADFTSEFHLFNFDAGGAWNGKETNLDGEYGFSFKPLKELNITEFGRQAPGHLDRGYGVLKAANVTLWEAESPNKTYKGRRKLWSERVGPDDELCCHNKYNMHRLQRKIMLEPGRTYYLTQDVWRKMDDPWFDNFAMETDVAEYSLISCIEVGHGVHSKKRHQFPDEKDRALKRVGMLNLRIETKGGCGIAIPAGTDQDTTWFNGFVSNIRKQAEPYVMPIIGPVIGSIFGNGDGEGDDNGDGEGEDKEDKKK